MAAPYISALAGGGVGSGDAPALFLQDFAIDGVASGTSLDAATLRISSNDPLGDVLSIISGNGVTVAGTDTLQISYNGVSIGTATVNGAGNLRVTFNGSATLASVEAVADQVTLAIGSPGTDARSFTVAFGLANATFDDIGRLGYMLGGTGNDSFADEFPSNHPVPDRPNEVFAGGDGDDSFHVLTSTGPRIVGFTGGAGSDTLILGSHLSWITIDLGSTAAQPAGEGETFLKLSSVENISYEGDYPGAPTRYNYYAINVIGTDANNTLNILNGDLYGMGGDDILYGNVGIRDGGDGNDTLYASSGDLRFSGNQNGMTLISIENLVGDQYYNTFIGDDGANLLDGGSGGGDSLSGNGGNDVLIVGTGRNHLDGGGGDDLFILGSRPGGVAERDTVTGGFGSDTLDLSRSRARSGNALDLDVTTEQRLGHLYATLSGIENVIGNDARNVIFGTAGANHLVGGGGNDVLNGRDGNDVLDGGNGSDVLFGGVGADTMTGGAANDVYHVDQSGDQVIELFREGTDTVFTTIDYTLGANVEDLISESQSAPNLTLTGNELDNTIAGGAGADILTGGGGADRLVGRAGSDIFRYATVSDSATGTGTRDHILDFVQGEDRIDLSRLATDAAPLRFIGDAGFHFQAGEVRFSQGNGITTLKVDTDGNGVADAQIVLAQHFDLTSADLILSPADPFAI